MIGATLFRGTKSDPRPSLCCVNTRRSPVTMYCAGAHVRRAICKAFRTDQPYPHWTLRQALPGDLCRAITALPFPAPSIKDTQGSARPTIRPVFSSRNRTEHVTSPARLWPRHSRTRPRSHCCKSLRPPSRRQFVAHRILQDTDGFWLEPHTDIGAKLFTMLIYLSDHPDAERWGTDVLDAAQPGRARFRRPQHRPDIPAGGGHLAWLRPPPDPRRAAVADHQRTLRRTGGPAASWPSRVNRCARRRQRNTAREPEVNKKKKKGVTLPC